MLFQNISGLTENFILNDAINLHFNYSFSIILFNFQELVPLSTPIFFFVIFINNTTRLYIVCFRCIQNYIYYDEDYTLKYNEIINIRHIFVTVTK